MIQKLLGDGCRMPCTIVDLSRRGGCVLLLFWVSVSAAWAQSATVRGFVTAAEDGEPLQGVNVILDDLAGMLQGSATDGDGFYLIPGVEPGRYVLRATFIGFAIHADTLDLEPGARLLMNIAMETGAVEMGEVAVEAERESGAARLTAGLQSVRAQDIELVPAPDVSGDLVSYLSTMPSVVLMGDRGGQVFIRGGEPTQNLTLLDGMEVFQPFHVLGFYSAFPSEIVSRADIYAGGFGNKYVGRISSVIDVNTRNGNKRSLSASASMSPFTSAAHLEGPLLRDRISVLGSARFSTLDAFASQYIEAPLPFKFNDFFGKIHARVGRSTQVSVSALSTYDRGALVSEDDFFERDDVISWRNTAIGGRYLVAPAALSVLGEVLVSYSRLESEFGPPGQPTRTSMLETVNTALNMTNYVGNSEVNWGFFLRAPTTEAELGGLFQNVHTRRFLTSHTGAYLEPEIYLRNGLYIRPGLSVQAFGTADISFEPRLRVRWEGGIHHLSGAAGLYRQHIVGVSDRRDATNIFTAWIETPVHEGMRAVHLLLGYRIEPAPWLEVSLEGFYKDLDNLFIGEWTAFPSFTTRLQQAFGNAAGLDLRLELRRPHFYGFINYGYSNTQYEVIPVSEASIDPGRFRPPHDRRHQVNMLAASSLYGFDVSVRWQFGSGLPYTRVEGFDGFILMDGVVNVEEVRGFPRVIYERIPYQAILPAYHRLDISIERTFTSANGLELTTQVGLLNAYNRTNLFSLDLLTAQRSDQLPIIPVAGIKLAL